MGQVIPVKHIRQGSNANYQYRTNKKHAISISNVTADFQTYQCSIRLLHHKLLILIPQWRRV